MTKFHNLGMVTFSGCSEALARLSVRPVQDAILFRLGKFTELSALVVCMYTAL